MPEQSSSIISLYVAELRRDTELINEIERETEDSRLFAPCVCGSRMAIQEDHSAPVDLNTRMLCVRCSKKTNLRERLPAVLLAEVPDA